MVVVPGLSVDAAVSGLAPARSRTVLAIDRQPLFLDALRSVLASPPLSVAVSTCARTDEALSTIREQAADLVLCEMRAEPLTGPEFVSELILDHPETPVILLGEPDDEGLLAEAVSSRAAGLFTKDASVDEFLAGVHAVLGGHRAIGDRVMTTLLERIARTRQNRAVWRLSPLSRSEIEILTLVGEAKSISAIAAIRGTSHKTVRNHLSRIYRKLELHGRTEAMLWATRQGLSTQATAR
jgi:DNA-binding NarL/FixJ family response regulator